MRPLLAGAAVLAAGGFVSVGMEFLAFVTLFAGAWQLYPWVKGRGQ